MTVNEGRPGSYDLDRTRALLTALDRARLTSTTLNSTRARLTTLDEGQLRSTTRPSGLAGDLAARPRGMPLAGSTIAVRGS